MNIGKIAIALSIALVFIFNTQKTSAEFYQYKDENGVLHFSDSLTDTNEDQKKQAQEIEDPYEKRNRQASNQQKISDKNATSDKTASFDQNASFDKNATANKNILETSDPATEALEDRLKGLNKVRESLRKEYEDLMTERNRLETKRIHSNNTDKRVVLHEATQLNASIAEYQIRRQAFQSEQDEIYRQLSALRSTKRGK